MRFLGAAAAMASGAAARDCHEYCNCLEYTDLSYIDRVDTHIYISFGAKSQALQRIENVTGCLTNPSSQELSYSSLTFVWLHVNRPISKQHFYKNYKIKLLWKGNAKSTSKNAFSLTKGI